MGGKSWDLWVGVVGLAVLTLIYFAADRYLKGNGSSQTDSVAPAAFLRAK